MRLPQTVLAKVREKFGPTPKFDWADELLRVMRIQLDEKSLPIRECPFDTGRRRLDLGWPSRKIGIEIQGGQHHAYMGHRSTEGTMDDVRKANDAGLLGWRIIYFTGDEVRKTPLGCIERIMKAVNG